MSRADDLRAQFEADLATAELEDELIRLKEAVAAGDPDAPDDEGDKAELRRVKDELLASRISAAEALEAASAEPEPEPEGEVQ